MWHGSWIIDNVPPGPSCKILVDPNTERMCGNPASSGHTVLDLPICDDCFHAVGLIPERNLLAS